MQPPSSASAPSRAVTFVGGASSGKSTLTLALASALKLRGVDAELIPEHARTYLRRAGNMSNYLEQFPLFIETCRVEDETRALHSLCICDSASFVNSVYFFHYSAQPRTAAERRKWDYHYRLMHELARERLHVFDMVFYVPSVIPVVVEDPTRWNADETEQVGSAIEIFLKANSVPYQTLRIASR